jgi:hypothetical protein
MNNIELYDPHPLPANSFNGYRRSLTARGGFLIEYRDRVRGGLGSAIGFIAAGSLWFGGGWLILFESSWPIVIRLIVFCVAATLGWVLAFVPVPQSHRLEVHPDGLIVDDTYFFPADEIGDNWPTLQMVNDDPNRMVLVGICGTRFIEYSTLNRMDENDRTPERLIQDLTLAMEQLWARREDMDPLD